MSLLSLPKEILRLIMQLSRPDDFESLMLSCKRVHEAGQVFIAEHNDFKHTFCNVQINARSEPSDNAMLCGSFYELLGTVAANPRAATYIRALTIHDYRPYMPCVDGMGVHLRGDKNTHRPEPDRNWTLVTDLISDSPWLRAAGCSSAAWVTMTAAVRDAGQNGKEESNEESDNEEEDNQSWKQYAAFSLFVLLLTQLTHLETLHIKYDFHYGSSYEDDEGGTSVLGQAKRVLDIMSICANKNSRHLINQASANVSGLPGSPLEALAELYYCAPTGGSYPLDATALHPFIALPNLRRLRAHDLKALSSVEYAYSWPPLRFMTPTSKDSAVLCDTGDGPSAQFPYFYNDLQYSLLASREHSAVEYLELLRCDIAPQGVASLLKRMPLLTTLRYMYHHKSGLTEYDAQTGWDFDAGGLLQAIADSSWESERHSSSRGGDGVEHSTAASRITDLSIGIEDCPRHIITGITGGTLTRFTRIQRLALDVRAFLGPAPESGERRDSYRSWDPATSSWNPATDMPRLIDVLPRTLESLELFVDMQGSEGYSHRQYWDVEFPHWTKLLRGFREDREERLPNLREFVVRENPLMYKGHRPSGVYEEVVLSEDARSVANRQTALEAGADFVSVDGAQLSWRQGLEKEQATVY
ncbi:uncharacterized protein F5Z01DRAFT_258593 [Emericellopsis atlantica]|uniref:F-box domain-containing protein n=1 Tax=Emericellopsis atlantica TaxID=2614577 RepID=A0A9P8CMC0_9HYPO|nr:uncharacterized protein F5Z01DRAFT_258593 [Emericellopsis atlantica]KAG9251952.1 hypothetical protein F5Z01DRAFT_258593 [Emericellopsis atlantica]